MGMLSADSGYLRGFAPLEDGALYAVFQMRFREELSGCAIGAVILGVESGLRCFVIFVLLWMS